ncbi:hypothetical protein JTB14_001358 [Gonioctena quinquepunctata]|nr:hypothetical protein JTB14_001358 [Gonioctena quinquepunctata]
MGDSGSITRSKKAELIITGHQPVQVPVGFQPAHRSSSIGSRGDNPFSKSVLILRSPPHSFSPIEVTFNKIAKTRKKHWKKEQGPVISNTTISEAKTKAWTLAVPDFVASPQFNPHKDIFAGSREEEGDDDDDNGDLAVAELLAHVVDENNENENLEEQERNLQ